MNRPLKSHRALESHGTQPFYFQPRLVQPRMVDRVLGSPWTTFALVTVLIGLLWSLLRAP